MDQMEIATAVLAIALFIACAVLILFLVLKKPSNEPKGFTSRSVSRSGNDNSSSSLPVTSRNEGETLQSSNLKSFGYKELIASTGNFHPDCLLSEGGFGPVFKGWIDEHSLAAMKPGTGIAVVVMRLLLELVGFLGEREWLAKINKLGQLQHPNLVKLIGYCLEDEHRLLVYEFMPTGSPQNFASQLTALVVDDNKINRKIHQKMLNCFGVKSQSVENGKEAIDIHCYGQNFDLILMDMDMPIMNGIEEVLICSHCRGVCE